MVTRYGLGVGHKLVGLGYLWLGIIGGVVGFVMSVMIRGSLGYSGLGMVRSVKGCYMYNGWISGHGLVMLFLFVMPVVIGGFGNYLLPLLLGTSELVMPRLNGASVWLLAVAVGIIVYAQLCFSRPLCAGWTLYPPLVTRDGDSSVLSTDLSLVSVHVLGLSSGLGSFNFLATFKHGRFGGCSYLSVNLYVWALVVTSVLLVGALPVLGVAVTGLLLDRNVCTGMYDGILGGDPLLFQHLFWFFGHPEVYVVIVPVFGLISMGLGILLRHDVFGKEGMVYCLGSIGVVGYCVWAHHMFCTGMDLDSRAYFSSATAVVSIPTSVKVFSYLSSVLGSRCPVLSSAVWSYLSFLLCFTVGGFSGLMLSSASLDIVLHDTYFVVAHFHTVLSLGAVFGCLYGFLLLRPFFFGVGVMEGMSLLQVFLLLCGAVILFGPMHGAGVYGMSRRVPEYADVFLPFFISGSVGMILLLGSVLVFFRLACSSSESWAMTISFSS
jgi:heme/copper-type cytochrome/quinol oxidase subunit 1